MTRLHSEGQRRPPVLATVDTRRPAGYTPPQNDERAIGEADQPPQAIHPGNPEQQAEGVQGELCQPGPETAQTPPVAAHDAATPPQTALFESKGGAKGDAALIRRAVKHHWNPDPRVAQAILDKIGLLAMKDQEQGGFTKPQLLAGAKVYLDATKQYQSEEHHADRMEYADRSLQLRAKVGEFDPARVQVNLNTGGGPAAVSIFLPAVDEPDDPCTIDQVPNLPGGEDGSLD